MGMSEGRVRLSVGVAPQPRELADFKVTLRVCLRGSITDTDTDTDPLALASGEPHPGAG